MTQNLHRKKKQRVSEGATQQQGEKQQLTTQWKKSALTRYFAFLILCASSLHYYSFKCVITSSYSISAPPGKSNEVAEKETTAVITVSEQQLPPVFAISQHNHSNPLNLQFYHMSKCGGTTIHQLLRRRVRINDKSIGVLTDSGQQRYIGKFENKCDPKHCKRKSDDIFIIANIRNPFEFYVSYYNMVFQMGPQKAYEYSCLGPMLRKANMTDVYDPKNANDPETFHRWLDFVLRRMVALKQTRLHCSFVISNIYERMMLDANHHEVFDAMVRQEDFYPTLRRALTKYEARSSPGTVDWEVLDMLERTDHRNNVRKKNKFVTPMSIYSCYYTEASRRLVEWHDSVILKRFKYTFEQLGKCSN